MGDRAGIIGVGLLGGAIADRLARRGWAVEGYDVASGQREGVTMHDNPGSVLAKCDFVLLSLPTSQAVSQVIDELGEFVEPRHCFIDTTTGEPGEMEAIAKRLAKRGADYLGANVAGSSQQAEQGEATLFLGGSDKTIDRCQPVLEAIAVKRFHFESVGAASRFKLVHNLILGLNRAALAEGLAFAESLGFDAADALAILEHTSAVSEAMRVKGNKMAKADYEPPQAWLSQHLKDVRLILRLAKEAGAATPLSQAHQQLLEKAKSLGFGETDNAAVIEAYRANRKPNG
jgi:3-hydroxyisobutyrate dehydrogenase-like beta-hydroxyacid dehydrogenase